MKRLKELRATQNITQEVLAAKLKTTQQTIGRWESGKSEPNLATLRDLAMIFQTSVDDLLEFDSGAPLLKTSSLSIIGSGNDGFWGNVGIQLPHQATSTWFPVSSSEVSRLDHALENNAPFHLLETLNNRRLLLNMAEIGRIRLLDEACDQPMCDWNLAHLEYSGAPQEIYKNLEQFFEAPEELKENCSETFFKTLEDFVIEYEITCENYRDIVNITKVYLTNGSVDDIYADEDCLAEISYTYDVLEESDPAPHRLTITDIERMFQSYPLKSVAMISMPLTGIADDDPEF